MVNYYHKLPLSFKVIDPVRIKEPHRIPPMPMKTARSRSMEPHCIKFETLLELKQWQAGPLDPLLVPRVPIATRKHSGRKVMVVHDYRNGYLEGEDDSPLGYFPHNNGVRYVLQFPQLCDIFVYFTHHRVTVPPAGWVDSLHRLGIPVLGTLIFEGVEFDELLERDEEGFIYVNKLVELTVHYGFDGWLINVEAILQHSPPSDLVLFIGSLRSLLHLKSPDSQVIWYDSYISTNKVSYQNGVNERNYDHFENTDVFLTNYWWDESILKSNVKNIGSLGLSKLYVGVDVWGRGSTFGKGGLDIGTPLDSLRVHSSNVGIFAPAWTYEKNPDDFEQVDRQFWIGEPTEKFPFGGVSEYINEATAPVALRDGHKLFYTDFSQGRGHFFNAGGTKVYTRHWVNAALQTPTPLQLDKVSINTSDSFNGGSCLECLYSLENTCFKLFKLDTDITADVTIVIIYRQAGFTQDQISLLELSYYIERRYKTASRVRSGKITMPLKNTNSWNQVNSNFPFPRLNQHEHFVLEDISVRLVDYQADLTKSWVVLPMNQHKLLIDSLMITDMDKDDTKPITEVSKSDLDEEAVLVSWKDYSNVHYWIVYVNGQFSGAQATANFIGHRTDRFRVDALTLHGVILKGKDLFI